MRTPVLLVWLVTGSLACSDDDGTILPDASVDSSVDGGADAGMDAAIDDDGGVDSGTDAGADGATDAGPPDLTEPSPNLPPRQGHTATLLEDGRVLVVGGLSAPEALTSSWIYDPVANGWTQLADLPSGHYLHTATLLADGKVWVAGGIATGLSGPASAATAIFDPADDSWTASGDLQVARAAHQAVLIASGTNAGKVLVATGVDMALRHTEVELYDPVGGSSTFVTTAELAEERQGGRLTSLGDHRLLLSGGGNPALDTAILYDGDAGTWTATANTMSEPRAIHASVRMDDGRVLLAAGAGSGSLVSDLFDPTTNMFTATGATEERTNLGATLLLDGSVLLIGGTDGMVLSSAVRFSDSEFTTVTPLEIGLAVITATTLRDGRVLVVGGQTALGFVAGTSLLYAP